VLAVVLSGCLGPSQPRLEKADVLRLMNEYLEAKYGQTFELCNASWGREWGSFLAGTSTSFGVRPADDTLGKCFGVVLDTSTTPISFHDGYVGHLMWPVYEAKAREIAVEYFPGAVITVTNPGDSNMFPDDMGEDSTFEQVKTYVDSKIRLIFVIYYPLTGGATRQDAEALMPILESRYSELAAYGTLVIYAYSEEVWNERVVPRLDDPEVTDHMPAGTYIAFELRSNWRI